jgi:hypothetical protein
MPICPNNFVDNGGHKKVLMQLIPYEECGFLDFDFRREVLKL